MSSELKIEANRRNSQKSTGPRTVAGKTASSLNHTSHGIYAESHIVIGECQSDLENLAAGFYTRFQPDTPEQLTLVDILVHSEWILRRLRRAETGIWDRHIEGYGAGNDTNDLGRMFQANDRTFARLQRRLDCMQRNFERALKDLNRLRPERPAQPEPAGAAADLVAGPVPLPPPPPPETAAVSPQKPVIGFMPPPPSVPVGFVPSRHAIYPGSIANSGHCTKDPILSMGDFSPNIS